MFDEWHIENRPPTDGELIAAQARRIERLEQLVRRYDALLDRVRIPDDDGSVEIEIDELTVALKKMGLTND